jgi:hypothetical protein
MVAAVQNNSNSGFNLPSLKREWHDFSKKLCKKGIGRSPARSGHAGRRNEEA